MAKPSLFIKLRLLECGVTGREIARRAGVDATYVSHVIAGRRRSANVEQVIADAIDSPVDALFPPAKRKGRATDAEQAA